MVKEMEIDINILFYEEEKKFMQGITKIFIENVIPDIKIIYEYMKNSNYTIENPLNCVCDIFIWMENNDMYFENQNNKYKVYISDWFGLENVRCGKHHNLTKDIYDTIITISESNIFGITFGSYDYVKDIPSTLSCIFEEIEI